jgi:peptidoglycan/xylan/chitin deacetylase (PgdA/CDA1 family)
MLLGQQTMAAWLPILTFHDISDRRSAISIPPEVFRSGMAKLFESGYQTLSLSETVDYLNHGASFPDCSLVITFDDGFQSVYEEAFSVLQRYGMSATVFLTVGEKASVKPADRLPSWESRSMLSWREIKEMQRNGITFGAHTLTHPDLTRLPMERIEAEVGKSKAIIEDALSAPVTCFAYPYGRFDHRVREIVRQNFACACTDELGVVTAGNDPYVLKRVDSYYLRTNRLFGVMLNPLFPWYVRARSIPRQIWRTLQLNLRK